MLRYYMERALQGGTAAFFTVYNADGVAIYTVAGARTALSGKMSFLTSEGAEAARITGVGTPVLYKFTIEIPGAKKTSLIQNAASFKGGPIIRNPNWSFRGELFSGQFELIDVDRTLIMRQEPDWRPDGSGWDIYVAEEKNALRCLCICAVTNTILPIGLKEPVPG